MLSFLSGKAQQYYFRHYQVEDGLSHNTVFCVLQDQKGFLWMGTKDGLNRFDGNIFKVFRNDEQDSTTIGEGYIYSLHEDTFGQMWVGTSSGIYKYIAETESFKLVRQTKGQGIGTMGNDARGDIWYISGGSLYQYIPVRDTLLNHGTAGAPDYVTAMRFMNDGSLWIGTYSGLVMQYGHSGRSFYVFGHSPASSSRIINRLEDAGNGRMLVGTTNQGLKLLHTDKGTYEDILSYKTDNIPIYIRHIHQTAENEYWIATESGIYIYNLAKRQYINLRKQYNNPYSLSDNAVYFLERDKEGGVWAGTYFGGINYYPPQYTYFEKYFPDNSNRSISGNAVREICEDQYGNIWIGTEDNGINKLEPASGNITQYKPGKDGSGLSHTNIHGLLAEGNNLWIGTLDNGIDQMDIPTGKVIRHYSAGEGSFSHNFVVVFYKTSAGDLLTGTGAELARYEPAQQAFVKVDALPHCAPRGIDEDTTGMVWVATADQGLFCYNPATGEKAQFTASRGEACALVSNELLTVLVDKAQNVWVGTEGHGMMQYDRKTQCFRRYTTAHGLPSNYVFRILEDNSGRLWITTSRGLACLNPASGKIRVFTTINGLLNNQFNYNSGYKDKHGKMYIGSVKGMITFKPDEFRKDTFVAPVYITGFTLSGGGTATKDRKSILYTGKITLPYDQASFSIDFSALSFTAPEMISYAYKMEGLDREWTFLKSNRLAYFTDIKPGKYVFKVTTTDANGHPGKHPATLEIEITPPFWATSPAYLFYALLGISLLYYLISHYHYRQNLKQKRKMEELRHKKEKELYQAKVDFLTNVAHEINTPLTLIKGPLELVIEHPDDVQGNQQHLRIMERNTDRLVQLTNQLLDFRKTESSSFSLHFTHLNISRMLQDTYDNFRLPARKKRLDFRLKLTGKALFAYADEESINKIFSNLFSNAVKYAEKTVLVELSETDNGTTIQVEISNDGNLIPDDMREKIFAPFVRLKENEKQKGTGIGLSICRSLTDLHNGSLFVTQRDGRFNTFVFRFPVTAGKFKQPANPSK